VPRVVDLKQGVLDKNDRLARALRADLGDRGVIVINLVSGPGSGKTALLEEVLRRMRAAGHAVAALTGDLATENDARRLARSGAPVRQIMTDGNCHLEADIVRDHLEGWLPEDTEVLLIENVGNLVCPANYDLGESLRIVIASVTEGEDKPLKYPTMFFTADLVVISKIDLAEAAEFDRSAFLAAVAQVHPGVEVLETSARTGDGIDEVVERILGARG
jgi:hydrogenase nickel incorporation protein HypB